MPHPLRTLLVASAMSICLPICTQAHMQMSWPYPLRSPLDPEVEESLKDYSMTSPLLPDGSNFACKKYQYTETNSQANDVKAVYQAGSTYNMSITGTATHLGGSCQISLSYDNGATFRVIESQIGGCSLVTTHNFTIPSFAPSSDSVLLSWSWFNLIGNREMYQNCARVSIQNQNQPIPRYRRALAKRQTSLDDLPNMFVCNVGNGCTTIERSEVVFPEPGDNVVYGHDGVTANPGPGYKLASPSTVSWSTTSAVSGSSISLPTSSIAPFPLQNQTYWGPTAAGSGSGTGFSYPTAPALTKLTNSSSSSSTTSSDFTTPSPTTTSSLSTSSSSTPNLGTTSTSSSSTSSSSISSSSISSSSISSSSISSSSTSSSLTSSSLTSSSSTSSSSISSSTTTSRSSASTGSAFSRPYAVVSPSESNSTDVTSSALPSLNTTASTAPTNATNSTSSARPPVNFLANLTINGTLVTNTTVPSNTTVNGTSTANSTSSDHRPTSYTFTGSITGEIECDDDCQFKRRKRSPVRW